MTPEDPAEMVKDFMRASNAFNVSVAEATEAFREMGNAFALVNAELRKGLRMKHLEIVVQKLEPEEPPRRRYSL
jgi:predicted transcriptional regulator